MDRRQALAGLASMVGLPIVAEVEPKPSPHNEIYKHSMQCVSLLAGKVQSFHEDKFLKIVPAWIFGRPNLRVYEHPETNQFGVQVQSSTWDDFQLLVADDKAREHLDLLTQNGYRCPGGKWAEFSIAQHFPGMTEVWEFEAVTKSHLDFGKGAVAVFAPVNVKYSQLKRVAI